MDDDDSNSDSNISEIVPRYPISRRPRILLGTCGCIDASKFGLLCQCFSAWANVGVVFTDSSVPFVNAETIPNLVVGGQTSVEYLEWADVMVIAPLSANTLAKRLTPFETTLNVDTSHDLHQQLSRRLTLFETTLNAGISHNLHQQLSRRLTPFETTLNAGTSHNLHQQLSRCLTPFKTTLNAGTSHDLHQQLSRRLTPFETTLNAGTSHSSYQQLSRRLTPFETTLNAEIVRSWDRNKPFYVAPAMDPLMWNNPLTERQRQKCVDELGINVIAPSEMGQMAEPSEISYTVKLSNDECWDYPYC
ncbi:hypothetical protein ACSQ67_016108 [Phaseolus vulgaris]